MLRRFLTVLPIVSFILTVLLAAPAWAQTTLSVTKSESADPVRVGETLTYTITVQNTGAVEAAQQVRLEDVLPANTTFVSAAVTVGSGNCTEPAVGATGGTVRCNLGNIAPGPGAETVEIQVKPTAAAGEAGFVDNTATAEGSNTNRARDTERTTVLESGITIEKDDFPDPADVGESLLYRLEVTNDTGPTRDVNVVDELPDDVEFISVNPSEGRCTESNNVVRCSIDNLAAGETATIRIFVEPLEEGTLTNTAQVFAQGDRFTPIAEARERTVVEERNTNPDPDPDPTDPTDPTDPDDSDDIAETTTPISGAEATTPNTEANAADLDDATGADAASGSFRCELFLRVVEDNGFDGRFDGRFAGRRQYFDGFDDFDDDLLVQRIEECRERQVLADTIPDGNLPDTGGSPLALFAASALLTTGLGLGVSIIRRRR